MADSTAATHLLSVETRPVDDISPLIPLVDPRDPLVFLRRGQGVVGIGEALRLEFTGPARFTDAAAAWRALAAAARVDDTVGAAGTGLIAFGSFAFDDASLEASTLIVPRIVVGRRQGRCWVTRIADGASSEGASLEGALLDGELEARPFGPEVTVALEPGLLSREGYERAVAEAVRRIRRHELDKVVIARDAVGMLPPGADLRRPLAALAQGYPDCHTYAVDGLIGSSPETLVRVHDGEVGARVLAGSTARGGDAAEDDEAAAALATSTKDLDEHEFAVRSVITALRPHTRALLASEQPFTLKLPNLWHLATDVEGTLSDGASALDLIGALHPTAAVAGSPTARALALIRELEPFDRGRYAGPVGWVGADGDGEWAIALRGASVARDGRVTAFAGAGVVADSDPEWELAETRMKFRPIRDALAPPES